MATANFFAPGFDDQIEQQAIDRQRKMADMLRQQSMQPLQAKQVGQYYAQPHWTQQLSQALGGFAADKEDARITGQQKALAQAVKTRNEQEMGDFMRAAKGAPEQIYPQQVANDEEGNAMPQAKREATQPDLAKALQIGMDSHVPGLQAAAGTLFNQQFVPKTPKWEKFDKPDGAGGHVSGFVDTNSQNPLSTFQAGGAVPVKGIAVNGTVTNPFNIGGVVPKQPEAPNPGTHLVLPDPNNPGKMIPNQPLIDAREKVGRASASNQSVSVNTATKPFLNEIGKGVGEAVVAAHTGAQSAVQSLNNVAQIRSGLDKAIVGPFANQRVKLSQIGEIMGINGKDSTEQLSNTRNVIQGLARQELAAAGQMKGQGQITENERKLLQRAESGQIDELTKPEINTLLTAIEKTSKYRIGLHQANMDKLRKDPNAAGVVDYMNVNVPQTGGGTKFLGFE